MEVIEIIFLVLGVVVFIVSFLLPAGRKEDGETAAKISEEAIREMVNREIEDRKTKINEIVDETVTYSMEKAERSMERLTNEKVMAVSEYSDTVLGEINKNHQEVVFLYDMLNDKHENLTAVVSEAAKTASEVKQTQQDADIAAKEMEIQIKEAKQAVKDLGERAGDARQAVEEADVRSKEILKAVEEAAERAQKAREEAAFKPIKAEVIKPSVPEEQEKEKPKGAGKTARKPRAPRAPRKDVKAADEAAVTEKAGMLLEDAAPIEVPDVAVSLNEEGNNGGRNNNERILELHKTGKSNMAIAKELGLGIGEVKLVIDLFEGM